MTAGEISHILLELRDQINHAVDAYITLEQVGATNGETDSAQQSLYAVAGSLARVTANPVRTVRQLDTSLYVHGAIRIAADLGIFKLVTEREIATVEDIHHFTKADPVLIHRLMRLLSAANYISEVGPKNYAPSSLTKALTIDSVVGMTLLNFDFMYPIALGLPAYLKENHYQPLQESPAHHHYGLNIFEYNAQDPSRKAIFDDAMRIFDLLPPDTVPHYPFAEALHDVADTEIAVVDIGGGKGQWLSSLPKLPGRLVLQDLKGTVDSIDPSTITFEAMTHDFITPQPIKGARFYHLRYVLHDWLNADALRILQNIAPAFTSDHTRLLINERVLPDVGCELEEAIADFRMMKLGGLERSDSQWKELLASAGFEIVEIWRAESGHRGIIECKLHRD